MKFIKTYSFKEFITLVGAKGVKILQNNEDTSKFSFITDNGVKGGVTKRCIEMLSLPLSKISVSLVNVGKENFWFMHITSKHDVIVNITIEIKGE